MNGKEALGILYDGFQNGMAGRSFYDIIKQDLEKLEELEKEYEKLKERYKHRAETSNDLCKEVRQYEKAFEIIKEKKVDIPKLLANDFNNYNALAVFFGFKQLTQEEYELLKEVLNNGR